MTKFSQKSFSIGVGSKKYRDNWDSIFNKCKKCNGLGQVEFSDEAPMIECPECGDNKCASAEE